MKNIKNETVKPIKKELSAIKKRTLRTQALKRPLKLHGATFTLVNVLLLSINLLFSPQVLWFIIPLLGWFIGLTLHFTAFSLYARNVKPNAKKGFISHLILFVTVNLLLTVIDFLTSNSIKWAYFPIIFWGAGLLMHYIVYNIYLSDVKSVTMEKKKFLDKQRALQKKRALLSASSKQLLGSPSEKQRLIENKESTRAVQEVKKVKKVVKKDLAPDSVMSEAEMEELARTESEVAVKKNKVFCLVHKGHIDGTVYICPSCQAYYCLKCAQALKEKDEKCWSCESELNP